MNPEYKNKLSDIEQLNPDSVLPLYFQLKEVILKKIEDQQWPEGSVIPSENELQHIFGISRATVRRTMEILVTEGYLKKRKGKGTFVTRPKLEEWLPTLTSFTEEMTGRDASKKVLMADYIEPAAKVKKILKLLPDEKVLFLKRLMLVDKTPLGILYEYIPGRYNLDPNEDYAKSLYNIFAQNSIQPKEADQTVEASISTQDEMALMRLKKRFPTLVIRRLVSTAAGDLLEYVKGVYHGNRYRYQIKLYREKKTLDVMR